MNMILALFMMMTMILAYPLSGDDRKQVSPLPPTAQSGDTDDNQDDMGDVYEDEEPSQDGVVIEDNEDEQQN